MAKTLQITIISVAILMAGFFGFSAFFGEKKENVDKFLDSADAINKFKSENGKKQKNNQARVSPLVSEARQFALYLDPPPPPVIVTPNGGGNKGSRPVIIQAPAIPIIKFELLATIVDTARPEESRALIDLPGTGPKVVKQGQEVGRTVIVEVKNGSIMVKAGDKTEELMAKKTPVPSLIKGSPNHIFKLFPDLKNVSVNLPVLGNVTGETPAPGRLSTNNPPTSLTLPTNLSRRPDIRTSARATTSTSRYKASSQGVSSRNSPPKLTPEQEEKAMKELLDQLSKAKNKDGTDMGAEMKNLIETIDSSNDTTNNEEQKPAQTNPNDKQKKADPNKPK